MLERSVYINKNQMSTFLSRDLFDWLFLLQSLFQMLLISHHVAVFWVHIFNYLCCIAVMYLHMAWHEGDEIFQFSI